jgi:hypothetical protein
MIALRYVRSISDKSNNDMKKCCKFYKFGSHFCDRLKPNYSKATYSIPAIKNEVIFLELLN